MEEIRNAALAYYAKPSMEEKQVAECLFRSFGVGENGKIGFQAYEASFAREKQLVQHITAPRFFRNLDKDNDGFLEKQDIFTLAYIIRSGRLQYCDGCHEFLTNQYFVCSQCYEISTAGSFYKLCSFCYRSGTFSHHKDAKFIDSNEFMKRKKQLMEAAKRHQSGNSAAPNNKNSFKLPQQILVGLVTASIGGWIGRELVVGTGTMIDYLDGHASAAADATSAAADHVASAADKIQSTANAHDHIASAYDMIQSTASTHVPSAYDMIQSTASTHVPSAYDMIQSMGSTHDHVANSIQDAASSGPDFSVLTDIFSSIFS